MFAKVRLASRNGLLASLWLAALASPASAIELQTVNGQLMVGDGISLADAGAIVVFLEDEASPLESPLPLTPPDTSLPVAAVRQSGARFEPQFLTVVRGQTVEMPNDDVIYHNVFSYSDPNDFDLGMYPAGQSRSVRFRHSGLVRIYCSIHEDMDGLIFVAPSPLFAVPDSTGHYVITNVPAGLYRLHVWTERLPEVVAPVQVGNSRSASLDLVIGATSDD